MNYLKLRAIKKSYFGYEEIARSLGISLPSARVASSRFVKNGILIRLKRNIYILRDKWEGQSRQERFVLANSIQSPSYISLMTALSYYEVTTQIQRDFIESVVIHRTKEIKVEGAIFNYSKINKGLYFGFFKKGEFFIALPEKAFLDALYFKSLGKYSFDITSIDFNKLDAAKIKKMLIKYPRKVKELAQRYGYFKKA